MKKLIIVLVALAMAGSVAMAAPRGQQRGVKRGAPGMMFRLVAEFRAELNLTADQNQQLDDLLNEVKGKLKNRREERGGQMGEAFIADDFNAQAIHEARQAEREQFRAEMQTYMADKIQRLHDILTKEQREQLVQLAEEKGKEMRKRMGERRQKRMERR